MRVILCNCTVHVHSRWFSLSLCRLMERMENKGAQAADGEKQQDDARIGLTAKYKAQRASGDR